ncbi:type II secretion system protein N [Polymorphobacter sp.]|uniref:type II secretion system protein N n=1 Tax=Polymorphobacter sp. TaxID=1909290 RepID=UPI003F711F64
MIGSFTRTDQFRAWRDAQRWPAVALVLVEAALVCLAALGIVRLAFALVVAPGPVGAWQTVPAAGAIDRTVLARFDPFFRRRAMAGGEMALSDLELVLMGTRVDQASGRGSAILALSEDRQESFGVGDEILPGVRLVDVGFDSVTLDNGGKREQLFLDQSAPVSDEARDAGAMPVPSPAPAVVARLQADLSAVPRLSGTMITGWVLTPRGSGAAFAAAGLRSGDVLLRVDGQEVAALGDPAAVIRRLDAGGVMLEIERGGQPVRLRLGPGGVAA